MKNATILRFAEMTFFYHSCGAHSLTIDYKRKNKPVSTPLTETGWKCESNYTARRLARDAGGDAAVHCMNLRRTNRWTRRQQSRTILSPVAAAVYCRTHYHTCYHGRFTYALCRTTRYSGRAFWRRSPRLGDPGVSTLAAHLITG